MKRVDRGMREGIWLTLQIDNSEMKAQKEKTSVFHLQLTSAVMFH